LFLQFLQWQATNGNYNIFVSHEEIQLNLGKEKISWIYLPEIAI
jgi:hypothetical protein